MIHFFYRPSQNYLKKFPVSIFEQSFLRYEDDVKFKVLDEKFMGDISPRDSVFFYNIRYASQPKLCNIIEGRGAYIVNKPKLNGKIDMAKAFDKAGLPSPRSIMVPAGNFNRRRVVGMKFPLIIKPVTGSSGGKGIYFCESPKELPKNVKTEMIVQEYIMGARDHIIRINTIDDSAVMSMKVFSDSGSPIINASADGSVKPYSPTKNEADLAVAGAKIAGLDISGIDMAQTESGPMLIEVNAVPGFASGSKLGVNFPDLMVDLIVKRAREQNIDTPNTL